MTAPEFQTPSRVKRHAAPRRKPWRFLYGIAGLFLLACLATGGYAAYLYFYKFDSVLDRVGTEVAVPADQSAKVKPLTILLLGLDSRPETGSLNTDVIMTASLNPATQKASVVSIPRDTYLKPMLGLRGNKANAFYPNLFVSDKSTALKKIKEVFGTVLDVKVDYVVLINFKAFQDIVDALGGITVDVDQDMRYVDKQDGTDIHLKQGVQKLSGKQALDFVRYRKSNNNETPESGDMERNERQQKVVAEVLGQLKSAGGVLKLNGVLDAVGDNVSSDIPKSQLQDFIRTYMGIDKDNITYIHLEGVWKSPYVTISEEDWQSARSALDLALNSQ